MRQYVARYTTSLVTDTDDDMLRRLTDCDLDGWGRGISSISRALLPLNDSLDTVSKKLADYIFKMGEDVRECCLCVARQLYLWENDRGPVSEGAERCYCFTTSGNDLAGIAFEEDFADELGGWSRIISEMPRTIEGACQG